MKVKNKHPVLSDFLREKHPPYEQIDSKSIKTTSTMPYKDAEEASQVKDLTNFNHFRKWQSIVKIVSLVVFSMVILPAMVEQLQTLVALMIPRKVPNMPPTIKMLGRMLSTSLVLLNEKIPSTRLKTGFEPSTLFEISWKSGW